jgi:hypothetical protein
MDARFVGLRRPGVLDKENYWNQVGKGTNHRLAVKRLLFQVVVTADAIQVPYIMLQMQRERNYADRANCVRQSSEPGAPTSLPSRQF